MSEPTYQPDPYPCPSHGKPLVYFLLERIGPAWVRGLYCPRCDMAFLGRDVAAPPAGDWRRYRRDEAAGTLQGETSQPLPPPPEAWQRCETKLKEAIERFLKDREHVEPWEFCLNDGSPVPLVWEGKVRERDARVAWCASCQEGFVHLADADYGWFCPLHIAWDDAAGRYVPCKVNTTYMDRAEVPAHLAALPQRPPPYWKSHHEKHRRWWKFW